jgi:hypothetical protein
MGECATGRRGDKLIALSPPLPLAPSAFFSRETLRLCGEKPFLRFSLKIQT